MKYLTFLLLLVSNPVKANPMDNVMLEFGYNSCLIGYLQNYVDSNVMPTKAQIDYSEAFCKEYAKKCVEKLNE
jgi:hypothetical protein